MTDLTSSAHVAMAGNTPTGEPVTIRRAADVSHLVNTSTQARSKEKEAVTQQNPGADSGVLFCLGEVGLMYGRVAGESYAWPTGSLTRSASIPVQGFALRGRRLLVSDINFAMLVPRAARIPLLAEKSRLAGQTLPRVEAQEISQAMRQGRFASCAASCRGATFLTCRMHVLSPVDAT